MAVSVAPTQSTQPPPSRSVARPVSNLGNTCYMNAVLQALAHAPELCLAMDCNPHCLTCPIAADNALKRRRQQEERLVPSPQSPTLVSTSTTTTAAAIDSVPPKPTPTTALPLATLTTLASPSTSSSVATSTTTIATLLVPPNSAAAHPQRTRQSSRRTAAAAAAAAAAVTTNENGTTSAATTTTTPSTTTNTTTTAPTPTIGGRKSPRTSNNNNNNNNHGHSGDADSTTHHHNYSSGHTTDSDGYTFCALCEVENYIRQVHDASLRDRPFAPTAFVHGFMEHVAPWFALGVQEDSHEFLRLLIDAMQKSCRLARVQDNPQDVSSNNNNNNRPFRHASDTTAATASVTPALGDDEQDTEYPFSLFRGTVESNVVCASCKATSVTLDPIEDVGLEVTVPPDKTPTPTSTGTSRGSATNTSSRNVSPVPVASALTDVQTAFQRFAQTEALDMGYKCESCGKVGRATKQSRLASIPPILTLHLKRFRYGDRSGIPAQATATRRSCRSEVSQLLGNNEYLTGKSGSAKIEGHIKFDLIFDLKPYLTDELKFKHTNMFCRLFAVIVHAGKNSHSGHYIAFVRDVSQNEWWKMDDSRVTSVTIAEVMQAEAYMLLYRVVQHPVAVQLEELQKQQMRQELASRANVGQSTSNSVDGPWFDHGSRKRPHDDLDFDEDWLHQRNFPQHLVELVQKVMEMMAGDIQVTERFRKTIEEEASVPNSTGPTTKLSEVDVVGGTSKYAKMICELFYRLKNYPNSAAPWLASIINGHDSNAEATTTKAVASTSEHTASPPDMSDKRVALEEPDDSSGLL